MADLAAPSDALIYGFAFAASAVCGFAARAINVNPATSIVLSTAVGTGAGLFGAFISKNLNWAAVGKSGVAAAVGSVAGYGTLHVLYLFAPHAASAAPDAVNQVVTATPTPVPTATPTPAQTAVPLVKQRTVEVINDVGRYQLYGTDQGYIYDSDHGYVRYGERYSNIVCDRYSNGVQRCHELWDTNRFCENVGNGVRRCFDSERVCDTFRDGARRCYEALNYYGKACTGYSPC